MLILCLLPIVVRGQEIVYVMSDTTICNGDSLEVGMGLARGHEVVVKNAKNSMTHGETAFLPDGVECDSQGCSYRSPVTFSGFPSGAVISSANDIKYIRINMEHSFLGDLYINVTCPNGQSADILKFSDYNTNTSLLSSCLTGLPASSHGWNGPAGSNEDHAVLGNANTNDDPSTPCQHDSYTNAPGTGWNYCWSNNTNSGYSYAADGGYVYRTSNQTYAYGAGTSANYRVDSSNVAAGMNFYHPDESFASLAGCPLNGEWYIEVIDAVRQDNGYIFDWELMLSDDLLTEGGLVSSYTLSGDSVRRKDDSTFVVSPPAGSATDTTVTYRVTIGSTSGEELDTVLTIHFVPQLYRLVSGSYCTGDTVKVDELLLTETTHRIDTLMVSGTPCPVTREIDVTFRPSYEVYDTVSICSNQRFVYNGTDYGGPGSYEIDLHTAMDCDSTIHLTLKAIDENFKADAYLSDNGLDWWQDTMLAGCAPFTVSLADSTLLAASTRWHTGDTGWFARRRLTHTYDSAGVYSITLAVASPSGCRDTLALTNAVWVFDRPEADFRWEPEEPVMSHPHIDLYATQGEGLLGYTWAVPKGDGSGADTLYGPEMQYTWNTEEGLIFGDYGVTLIETRHHRGPYGAPKDCYDTVQKTITIINDWLQFPNLVTPNGDGTSDTWRVVNLLECGVYSMNEVWIYSAWGSLVYHAKNIAKEEDFWDPEQTGSPDGTYYFRFLAKSLYGSVKRNGMIEVVR